MTRPTTLDPWASTPRLLQELCQGHGAYMAEVYALDYPNRARLWMCRSCWVSYWHAAGKPPQTTPPAEGDAK